MSTTEETEKREGKENDTSNKIYMSTLGAPRLLEGRGAGNLKWRVDPNTGELKVWEQKKTSTSKKRKGKGKGKGKGQDLRCRKRSPRTLQSTRSRINVISNKLKCPLFDRVVQAKHGRPKRKRGREVMLKRTTTTTTTKHKKVSPIARKRLSEPSLNVKEEELRADGDFGIPDSSKSGGIMDHLDGLDALDILKAKIAARETKNLNAPRKSSVKRKAAAIKTRDTAFSYDELRRKAFKEKKMMRKPIQVKKEVGPLILTEVTREKTPLRSRGADGLHALRLPSQNHTPRESPHLTTCNDLHLQHSSTVVKTVENTQSTVPLSTHKATLSESSFNVNNTHLLLQQKQTVETIQVKEIPQGPRREVGTPRDKSSESSCSGGVKPVVRRTTSSALKIAAETSGFVRTTLKAVEDARDKNRKIQLENMSRPKIEASQQATFSLGSLRSKTTMSAEKLIEEFGTIRQAAKGSAKEIAKESRKAKKKAKQLKETAMSSPIGKILAFENVAETCEQKPVGRVPRPVRLGRNARKDIEKDLQKYSLHEYPEPQIRVMKRGMGTGGGKKRTGPVVESGFDRLMAGSSGDKEFQNALALAVAVVGDEGGQMWTKSQETAAMQDAYYSTTKPPDDIWPVISKRIPGRNTEECLNKVQRESRSTSQRLSPKSEIELPLSPSKTPSIDRMLASQKTIHSLRHNNELRSDEHHEIDAFAAAVELSESSHDGLDRTPVERSTDEVAVMLNTAAMQSCSAAALLLHPETVDADHTRFQNIVIGGVDTPLTDKENRMPCNAGTRDLTSGQEQLSSPEVLKVKNSVQQVEGERHQQYHRHVRRPSTTCNGAKLNKNSSKGGNSNHVYLHSNEALDFGETTLDAIHRAKQELRNVFLRTGSSGRSFFEAEENSLYGEPEDNEFDACTQYNLRT